jgi:flagellar hook-associated protein 2
MVTLDGVSRAVVIDDDFVKELKRIAYTYENSGTPPANDADRDAFDLYSVTDTDKQAQYLKDALQIRVNKLFENPPTKWADGTPVIGTPTSEDYLQMSSKITVTGTGSKIGFEAKDNSKLVLGYATSPASVSDTDQNGNPVPKALYDAAVEEMHKNTGLGALGFTKGASNKIDIYSSVASLAGKLVSNLSAPNPTINPADGTQTNNYRFIINDVSITVNDGESVSSFMNKVNSSAAGVTITYSEVTDKFTLTSKTQGEGQNIVMGDVNGNLLSALGLTLEKDRMGVTVSGGNDYADPMVYGKNAIAFIDGEKIERTSNEFTVNGVAYSLKDIYNYIPNYDSNDPPVLLNPPGSGAAKPSSPTSGTAVTLAPDATDLLKTVKDFVSDYNALVDLLYGLNNEEKYTDYEPLTEEERAAMSESQIKMWEDKAKSGLLRGDSTLGKILTSMRQAFLTTSGNFGLFSMGITYGSYSYKDNGKLQITDEAMLKSALESRPDQVRDLFTNASKGAITKLDKVIDDAVRTTGGAGYRGSLIEMAGLPSSLSEKDNAIYTQILNHNKRINMFKDLLEKEESRLWTKFSAMESALAKLNEQNNMISQYLGTGTKQ